MPENIANSESGPISGQQPAERADSPFKAEIAEILRSDEFTYALLATMSANTHHNDHNQFQNAEALNILRNFAKENADQDLIAKVATLAEFSKTNKSWDRNYSLVVDIMRLSAGVISLSDALALKEGKENYSQELKDLHSAAHIAQIISLAAQVISSPITANKGYQAAITGHLANEMGDAMEKVLESLRERIATSKIVQNLAESCSHPNHGHFGHSHSHEPEHEYHGYGHSHGEDHGHAHAHHAGSLQRHSGTLLNVASMALGIVRAASWTKEESGSNPAITDLQAAIMAFTAPILALAGKNLSLQAASIREKEVSAKTHELTDFFNKQLAAVFQQAQDLSLSSTIVSTQDAKKAIFEELIKIGHQAEAGAEIQRNSRGFFGLARDSGKYAANYMKDSFYGLSYEAIKLWQYCIPDMWQQGSSSNNVVKNNQAAAGPSSESLPANHHSDIESQSSQAPQTWKTYEELRNLIAKKYPNLLLSEQSETAATVATDAGAQDQTGLADLAKKMQLAVNDTQASHQTVRFVQGRRARNISTRRQQERIAGAAFPAAFFESPSNTANSYQALTLDAEITFDAQPNQEAFGQDGYKDTNDGRRQPITISETPTGKPVGAITGESMTRKNFTRYL